MSFTGEFRHSIDSKGRLIVPARLRDELGKEVVLTVWMEECVSLWPQDRWEERVADKLIAERSGNPSNRRLSRYLAANAHTDVVDGQGRISVPQALRDQASIDRDVVIIGALDHAEIWSPDKWQEEKERVARGGLDALARELDF